MVKQGLLYTKDHEWIKVEGNKATIGITDYAQHALGSIVYVELPEVDDTFAEGDSFGVIESVKAASDAYMPIDGTVLEINEAIVDDPALLNTDAFENWMIVVEIKDESQIASLLDADAYQALIG